MMVFNNYENYPYTVIHTHSIQIILCKGVRNFIWSLFLIIVINETIVDLNYISKNINQSMKYASEINLNKTTTIIFLFP